MATVISTTEALSLAETLGTLLAAIVDAQAQSARATVDFVREVGFQENTQGEATETLRTVSFRYRKLDENGERAEFVVELPLLGMVDIPSIAIKKATVAFDYEITSAQSSTPTGGSSTGPLKPGLFERLPRPAVLKGRVADQRSTQQTRNTLKVSVELEKAELPPSLDRVLDILTIATRDEKLPPPP
jgi:hypothetical protein